MDNVLIGKFPPFPYWRIGELQSTDYGRGERVEQYIYFSVPGNKRKVCIIIEFCLL